MYLNFTLPRFVWGESMFEFNPLQIKLLEKHCSKINVFSTFRLFHFDLWHLWFMSDCACGITLLGFDFSIHWD